MKFNYIALLLLALLISFSDYKEQDVCAADLNTHLEYTILDTFNLGTDIAMGFNDYSSIKSLHDTLYYSSMKNESIYGIDLSTELPCFKFSYAHLQLAVLDFFVGNKTYLLTDYPYQLLECTNDATEPRVITSTRANINGITSPFAGDKLYIDEARNKFQMFIFKNDEPYSDQSIYKQCNLDGSLLSSFGDVPKIARKSIFPLLTSPSKIDIDSTSILGFGYQDHITKYNNNTGEIQGKYCAKSNYIPSTITGLPNNENLEFQESANFIIQSPFYLGLYYDKYRKLYYRVAKHEQPLKSKDNKYKLNSRYDGGWSIIVMDDNLDIIGEAKMPPNTYQYYSCFVGKKGFYIALNEEKKKNAFVVLNFKINEH